MRARRAAALEGLDDDHAPSAARAGMREGVRFIGIGSGGIAGRVLRSRSIEQLPRLRDVLSTLGAGEQTVVTDAVEAAGHYVDEEAADELIGGERHHLGPLLALGTIVLPLEGNAFVVELYQAAVGDGDAVGVARQIGQHGLRAAEWALAVDDPFASA